MMLCKLCITSLWLLFCKDKADAAKKVLGLKCIKARGDWKPLRHWSLASPKVFYTLTLLPFYAFLWSPGQSVTAQQNGNHTVSPLLQQTLNRGSSYYDQPGRQGIFKGDVQHFRYIASEPKTFWCIWFKSCWTFKLMEVQKLQRLPRDKHSRECLPCSSFPICCLFQCKCCILTNYFPIAHRARPVWTWLHSQSYQGNCIKETQQRWWSG